LGCLKIIIITTVIIASTTKKILITHFQFSLETRVDLAYQLMYTTIEQSLPAYYAHVIPIVIIVCVLHVRLQRDYRLFNRSELQIIIN